MGRKRKAGSETPDIDDDCLPEVDQNGEPIQRNAANARERARMRVLSKAFSHLKMTLPWVPSDTKLSKLDTLRLASSYIAHLQSILDSEDGDVPLPAALAAMDGAARRDRANDANNRGPGSAGQNMHPLNLVSIHSTVLAEVSHILCINLAVLCFLVI